MSSTQRLEIANGHVPLAFLLGRRACEYSLPSLPTHPSRRSKPRDVVVLQNDHAHVRRRGELAKQLLERVLARESKLDTNQQYEPDTPLEAPLARLSTADRQRRATKLQCVLREHEMLAAAIADDSVSTVYDGAVVEEHHRSLYDQRERFASTHGYVLREPDFVEVAGSTAKLVRTQSLRQFHDDEKLRRAKQFRAKQSRVPLLHAELQKQQAETKARLSQAERAIKHAALHEATEKVSPAGADAIQRKQTTTKRWQDEQQRLLERTKEDETCQLRQRHESVQRARAEHTSAVKARRASSQYEKKTMANIKGVGPSFLSTLRVDSGDLSPSPEAPNGSFLLAMARTGESEPEGSAHDGTPEARLLVHQYELFQKSKSRSLHLGGGFASKPRDVSHAGSDQRTTQEDIQTILAQATSLPLTKSKRQVQDERKKALSAHG